MNKFFFIANYNNNQLTRKNDAYTYRIDWRLCPREGDQIDFETKLSKTELNAQEMNKEKR